MNKMAFREDSMGCTQVFEWFRHFKGESTSVESHKTSWTLSVSRNSEMIDKVHALLKNDRRLMIRKMSEEVRILNDSCHATVKKSVHEIRDGKVHPPHADS
jgi:hypothetical protein